MISIGTLELTDAYVGSTPIEKVYLGSALVWEKQVGPEPLYDAEIEYLQSTGNEYINTGIKPSTDIRLTIDGSFVSISGQQIIGSLNTTGTITRFHIGVNQNKFQIGVGTKYGTTSGSADTSRHLFQLSGKAGAGYVDTNGYTGNSTLPTALDMYLFARNSNGSASNFNSFKLYSAHVYKYSTDEKLVDFIPVRKGIVGYLYDKVSGTLFGNANSSGAFTLGPDVT